MNNVSFVGNLTREVKLSYSGEKKTPIARFSVAVNEGTGDNEKTHFVSVTAFGTLAENLADSLRKGARVIVVGRLDTYSKAVVIDGEEKNLTMTNFIANAVGPDLRWAVAKVARVEKDADERGNSRPASPSADEEEEAVPAPKAAPKAASSSTAKSRAKAPAPADDDDDDDGVF